MGRVRDWLCVALGGVPASDHREVWDLVYSLRARCRGLRRSLEREHRSRVRHQKRAAALRERLLRGCETTT